MIFIKRKKVGKYVDPNDKGNTKIKLHIPLNLYQVDPDNSKSDEMDFDLRLANSTSSQEMPYKTDKILKVTSKLTKDFKVLNTKHESRIAGLEKDVEHLQESLSNLVDINKKAMNNSVEGLKRVNEKVIIHKAQLINIILTSTTKSKKKNLDTNPQGFEVQVSTGPSTRTRRRN